MGLSRSMSRVCRLRREIAAISTIVSLAVASVHANPAIAQSECIIESEPNHPETSAPQSSGALCLSGELPGDDQDLLVWDLSGEARDQPWTLSLTGAPGILTRLEAYAVDSRPGEPIRAGRRLLELRHEPDAVEPVVVADLLLPDRLLIGIGRSDLVDGSEPTVTAYTLEGLPGAPLPKAGDSEPNDDIAAAAAVEDTFELSGDLAASDDVFSWSLREEAPLDGWRIDARGVAGTGLRLALRDLTGRTLATASADDVGRASLRDLRLPPGSFELRLSGGPPEGPSPYALTVSADVGPGDPEPNDDPLTAAALDLGSPTYGRLVGQTDIDFFRLPTQSEGTSALLDVRLIWRSGASRELCLLAPDRTSLQCRRGTEGIVLTDLFLGDRQALVSITGSPDPDDPYVLRVDRTSAPSEDLETEPNDAVDLANVLPTTWRIQGSGAHDDADLFSGAATGQPQLWRLDVEGSGIERVEWVRPDGSTLGSAEVARDGTSARLFDMYLVPGQEQLFRVRATGGDYRLSLDPLGPPDPNGEREPNDGQAFTDTLRVGIPRTGRLVTTTDVDEFRFSTAATDHLVLHVESPTDGELDLRLTDDAGLGVARTVPAGTAQDLDLLLPTGDYRLVMRSDAPGESRYALRLDRADPYATAMDQEPNDSPGWATPLAGNGRIEGTAPEEGEYDWYRLPPLEVPTVATLVAEDGVRIIDLMADAHTESPMEADPDGVTYRTAALQPGVDHFVRIQSLGDYAFTIDGLPSSMRIAVRHLEMSASIADDPPAAFWPAGQRLSGVVRLEDGAVGGPSPSVASLEATTSDDRWRVAFAGPDAGVPLDDPVEVPFDILVPRDVAADIPIRVTFRARTDDGRQGTASVDVTPARDAPPVGEHRAWTVPEALLGGLDLASPAFGAILLPSVDPEGEASLHDGLAPADGGLEGPIAGLPLELTVDLAGDAPVPVAGTILNALSADPSFGDSPARFEMELSGDGATWQRVLSGTLDRSALEQAFVLDEPTDARFARLRILTAHREGAVRISLGEWKVVAVPGTPSPVEPIDLAEPAIGGHIAWIRPQVSRIELVEAMIDEDPTVLEPAPAVPREPFVWAVGFFEGRAARITSIGWTDPPGSDPAMRFDRLEVAISRDGPLGPWEALGDWRLERGPGGRVAPFELEEPTWARFVRFTTEPAAKDARNIELPMAMRIHEAPTAGGYRSILGQWGLGERAGPLEASGSLPAGIADDPEDDSPDAPRPLASGGSAAGRVHHGDDVDWYVVSIPRDQRTLRAEVAGDPYVGVELVLHGPDATEVPMTFEPGDRPGTVLYAGSVEPGAEYLLEVRQPASSVVVTFDTSVSVGPYIDAILGSLREFGADVVPGREAVRILPFDGQPILPGWNDQPFELQAAASTYVLNVSSSAAERNLARAARDLVPRRGARAVLIITDAASSSYGDTADLWQELEAVRPLVFAVQTGGLREAPSWRRHHLMSDWAASAGGVYRYAHSRADIETAFDHLATWLRRPAGYRLSVETSPDELPPPEPGRLSVAGPEDASGRPSAVLASDVAVELILDTSGSMLESIGRERRIDVAKRVLVDLVGRELPPGIPVALRVFDDRARCGTELAVPLASLDPPSMIATIRERDVPRKAATPLAAAIEKVPEDLAAATGPRVVVVLSDGEESCDGDPEAAVRSVVDAGVDIRLNIVGFGLEDRKVRREMARLAEIGNGRYFDARRADDLAEALTSAVSAPYTVVGASGEVVAEGSVSGPPVTLPTGTYVVRVGTVPEMRFDEVYVAPGGSVELTLPVSEDAAS